MATDISVGHIEPEAPAEIPEPVDVSAEAPPAAQVNSATSAGEEVSFAASAPAPKRRGRPKAEPKPRGEPTKRGRPRKEPVAEPAQNFWPPEAAPIDVNAMLGPLFHACMQTSHMARRSAKQQQCRDLFHRTMSRARV